MPNDMKIEFAEDVGIAFNTWTATPWPTGYGRLTGGGTKPYVLPENTWYCVEMSYDGTGRVQQLFVNGTQLINATSYPAGARAFKNFKFGFESFHGPARQMWYDDVAVAPDAHRRLPVTRGPGPALSRRDRADRSRRRRGAARRRAAAALVYLAMRRPMRGTAASTCFFPVGRSFS